MQRGEQYANTVMELLQIAHSNKRGRHCEGVDKVGEQAQANRELGGDFGEGGDGDRWADSDVVCRVEHVEAVHKSAEVGGVVSESRRTLEGHQLTDLNDLARIDQSGPGEATDEQEEVDALGEISAIREDNKNAFEEVSKILDGHIASEDIILTFGYSKLCLDCFKDAKKGNKDLKVLVVDDQVNSSIKMVTELTEAGLKCYRVAFTSVFTVMPKVSKVIVDSCAVMADGGIVGFSGIYGLGITAKEYSVPFLVVSPLYKLTPKYCFGQQTFNSLLNPSNIIQEENEPGQENIDVIIPQYDFLPPDFITLHINQKGEHSTSYIYRLFNEIYTKEETNADY